MDEHTRKRARPEVDSEEYRSTLAAWIRLAGVQENFAVAGRNKDAEFWYEDGNVTLVAEDTGFRVYKGILAHHSPVFRDMFSLPQPRPASSPAGDDCPVVRLTDSPNDVRYLLRACMPKVIEDRYVPSDPTYDEIASLIRLGHKYQIQKLVDSSLAYLRRYYPDNFDAWDKLGLYKRAPKFRTANAIGVVNLARLTGDMRLLLPALLSACCLRQDFVFNGVPPALPGGQTEKLSMDDIQLCYGARLELASAGFAMGLRVCRPVVAESCSQPRICKPALVDLISTQHENSIALCANPFLPYSAFFSRSRAAVCQACYAMLGERDKSERRTMWKKLPQLLGVVMDGWAADGNAGVAVLQADN